ncbi:MAG: type II toxin-antitoxin system VapC family toxin [Rhodocyclaceae bacterium]|nr:type II toxin-antitoxin system VapC family toxin [Rhodocyclaceae bacterium]
MSGWLLDTNVVSEARKGRRANPGVLGFFREADPRDCYLPVQAVGEIRCGVERIRRRGDMAQADRLETWLERLVADYAPRIVGFDADCAQAWGALIAVDSGHPVDAQIAAIAGLHGLTVVTRNLADFAGTGVDAHDPFA